MATTWSTLSGRSVKAVCTTGTESAPTLATEGMSLDGVGGFSVHLEGDVTRTITTAGTLQAYLYEDVTGIWNRAPDLDLTPGVTGVRGCGFIGFTVPSARGRIAYLPSGVAVSLGNVNIFILATNLQNTAPA